MSNTCTDNNFPPKPNIIEEEDRPFQNGPMSNSSTSNQPSDIPSLIQLNDQKHSHDVDNFRNETGKHLLYGCLIAIALAAIADAIFKMESTLINDAFDLAKIITTTVLGYLFGSKAK